jgi:hypothetical protein
LKAARRHGSRFPEELENLSEKVRARSALGWFDAQTKGVGAAKGKQW